MRTDRPETIELPPSTRRRPPDAGILAEIAAGVAAGSDLHGLLERFLAPIMQIAGARAGAVRVLSPEGERLQMISHLGLPDHVMFAERAVDPTCGVCGAAFSGESIVAAADVDHCARRSHGNYFGRECRHVLAVPLTHRGRVLGLYNLFFDAAPTVDDESRALFKSIGELLGLALHNALLERETLRATVLAERQAMAAEVHDSIAQTLAFVKMRLPLLEEAIAGHDAAAATKYCADVRQAVGSAHGNLREVLAHFRAPLDPLGLRHGLHDCIAAFRQLTQIDVSFDHPLPELPLSVAQEFQVLRIVQEALANIAKHAGAQRVWLTIRRQAERVEVVVEDDGSGLTDAPAAGGPHYGLDIMRQRAGSLGGTLDVAAREGGGTRVQLRFPVETAVAPPWTR